MVIAKEDEDPGFVRLKREMAAEQMIARVFEADRDADQPGRAVADDLLHEKQSETAEEQHEVDEQHEPAADGGANLSRLSVVVGVSSYPYDFRVILE